MKASLFSALCILYLLALGGTITVLTAGGNILFDLLSRLFGENISNTDLLQNISGPLSLMIPFGALWGYYGGWLNKTVRVSVERFHAARE